MNPDLVTNESQIKRPPQPQRETPTECKNLNRKGKREMKNPQGQFESSDDESQEEHNLIPHFDTPEESTCIADSDSCKTSNNESTLDPETGLILDKSTSTGTFSLSAASTSSLTETVPNTPQCSNTHIISELMQSVIEGNLSSSNYYSRIVNVPNIESDSEDNGRLHHII
jgi:hypothetical protein